jgi:hypothetical protein
VHVWRVDYYAFPVRLLDGQERHFEAGPVVPIEEILRLPKRFVRRWFAEHVVTSTHRTIAIAR